MSEASSGDFFNLLEGRSLYWSGLVLVVIWRFLSCDFVLVRRYTSSNSFDPAWTRMTLYQRSSTIKKVWTVQSTCNGKNVIAANVPQCLDRKSVTDGRKQAREREEVTTPNVPCLQNISAMGLSENMSL